MFDSTAWWQTWVVWALFALSLARLALHFFPGLPTHMREGARGLLQRAGLAYAPHGIEAARTGEPNTFGCRGCSGCACGPQREATLQLYRREEGGNRYHPVAPDKCDVSRPLTGRAT